MAVDIVSRCSGPDAKWTYRNADKDSYDVCVQYKLLAIHEVSSTNQTFSVRITEELAVFVTQEDHKRFEQDPTTFRPALFPDTYAYNATEGEWTDVLQTIEGSEYHIRRIPGHGDKCFAWRNRIGQFTFNEPMELENFPFDVQPLTMMFGVQSYTNHMSATQLRVMPMYGGTTFSRKFVAPQGDYSVIEDRKDFDEAKGYIACTYMIRRRWSFFFYKVMFVLSMITLTALFAFVRFSEFLDQIAHLSTVLLTDVAYLYIVSTYIPTLSYLTLLDYFVIGNVVFVFAIAVEVTMIEVFKVDTDQTSASFTSLSLGDSLLILNLGVWGALNALFAVLSVCAYRAESKKLAASNLATEALNRDFKGMAALYSE